MSFLATRTIGATHGLVEGFMILWSNNVPISSSTFLGIYEVTYKGAVLLG